MSFTLYSFQLLSVTVAIVALVYLTVQLWSERRKRETAERTAGDERRNREAADRTAGDERRKRETADRTAEDERHKRETADRTAEDERHKRETADRTAEDERHKRETADRTAEDERHKRETADRTAENERHKRETAENKLYVSDTLSSLSKKCDTNMDFIRLLDIVDRLVPNSAVDLDQIYRKININAGASKTDYYAQYGDHYDDASADDKRTGSGRSGRSESQTSKINDFSRFRRHTSNFDVKRWMPSDDALYRIVCNNLFGGAESELDAFLRSASDVRHRCLKLLCYRPDYNENLVQSVFVMFLLTILGPMWKWIVLPIMGRALSATIPIKGVGPNDSSVIYENQTLKGFADVGIFARGTEKTANQPRVVVEIKKWLRGARAYQPKDQLIVEMEASRQAQARGNNNTTKAEKFVRGALTDMFALNIAIADATDSSVVFYMAQRVCAHRSYLLRLLFLLCENVSRSDWTPLLVETPVAVPTAGVVTRGNAARQVAPPPQNAASARKRVGHFPWQEREVVINFKEEDELEEQEEHYRSLLSMALRWQGINHLCAETLAEASKAAQAAANDNMALPMAAWAAQR